MKENRLFWLVALYFGLATIANAIGWAGRFDDRMLEYRHWDYGWELLLPWEASEGRWSGRDFVYPIGPLWQFIAWIPNIGRPFSAAGAVAGMHLVFPLLSLLTVALVVRAALEKPRARVFAFAAIGLLALHDDVRTFRSVLPLAVIVAYTHPKDSWQRAAWVGGLVAVCACLSLDTGLVAVLSAIAMGVCEAITSRPVRAALVRGGRALAAIAAGQAAIALGLLAIGGSYGRLIEGVARITSAYTVTMALNPEGFRPMNAAAFVVLALVVLVALFGRERRDPIAAAWLFGAAPAALRSVVRSDAEHVYAGLMPLGAILILIAARLFEARRVLASYAGALAGLFVLGWFGSHRDRPSAWDPLAFVRAGRVLGGSSKPEIAYRGDFGRIRRWLEDKRRAGSRCVGLPGSAAALHALVGLHGPTEMSLGWSAPLQKQMADSVRRDRCPDYLQELISFDGGSWGFGDYLLALSELYEPVGQIGPDLVVSRLRTEPAPPIRTPLAIVNRPGSELAVPGAQIIQFERPVNWDHALELSYRLDVPLLNRWVGGTPALQVQFFDGETPLGPAFGLPYPTPGESSTVVPVHPSVAEYRWVLGRAPDAMKSADRMLIRSSGGAAAPRQVGFLVRSLAEIATRSSPAAGPAINTCSGTKDLIEAARAPDAFFRTTSPHIEGDAISLPPNQYPEPDAELYVPIIPCKRSCLYAELGVAGPMGKGDGVDFEVHVIDGYSRPRLLAWHADPGISPKPAELPLATWAGKDVLVRFGVRSGKTLDYDDARIWRPRIARCAAIENLVVLLHDGRYRVSGGRAIVLGDQLRIEPARPGDPPVEVRIPIDVPPGACFAADAWAESGDPKSGRVGIYLGVVDGESAVRLLRPEMTARDQRVSLKEASLARWAGKRVEIRVAAWAIDDAPIPTAIVASPRIHECGDGAPWGFGAGAR